MWWDEALKSQESLYLQINPLIRGTYLADLYVCSTSLRHYDELEVAST